VQIPDMLSEGAAGGSAGEYLIGVIAAGISGFFSIRWFLGLIQRRGLRPFGIYCWIAMAVSLLVALARG
jgi:undecaprenyl pyrophosphate phosphatase UppP